ncbi:MAG: hypothetical protein RL263_1124 [Bacteroidota bacterium]
MRTLNIKRFLLVMAGIFYLGQNGFGQSHYFDLNQPIQMLGSKTTVYLKDYVLDLSKIGWIKSGNLPADLKKVNNKDYSINWIKGQDSLVISTVKGCAKMGFIRIGFVDGKDMYIPVKASPEGENKDPNKAPIAISSSYTKLMPGVKNPPLELEFFINSSVKVGVLPMWGNEVISDWQITKKEQENEFKLKINVPQEAGGIHKSYVRIWVYNEFGIGNDILVPLVDGFVMKDLMKFGDRKDPHGMIMYNIMIDRFFDGNKENNKPLKHDSVHWKVDYFGGDVAGITQKVESGYFGMLGINSLWISPVILNPSEPWGQWRNPRTKFSGYHGYWPISSTLTDPRYCTEAELKKFIEVSHTRHNNVYLDYVAHHIHQSHPLYKQRPDWYTSLYLPNGKKNTELWDEQRLTTWFDDFMPTFNFFKPEVVEAMTDSALFWVKKYDIDGFRHDATKHIPNEYWRALTYKMKLETSGKSRQLYQIGETYGSPALIGSYLGNGLLNAQFDFNMYDAAINTFKSDSGGCKRLAEVLNESLRTYGSHHLMGNITGNQDRPRFVSRADGSVKDNEDGKQAGWNNDIQIKDDRALHKLRNLYAFMSVIPGIPVIYYGDEIGMPGGNDPDSRRMMKFDLTEKEQEHLDVFRNLNHFRKSSAALNYGECLVENKGDDLIQVTRTFFNDETVVFLMYTGNDKLKRDYILGEYGYFINSFGEIVGGDVKAERNRRIIYFDNKVNENGFTLIFVK